MVMCDKCQQKLNSSSTDVVKLILIYKLLFMNVRKIYKLCVRTPLIDTGIYLYIRVCIKAPR